MATWITAATLPPGVWVDAAEVDPATLDLFLEAAQDQLETFGPALPADATEAPARYRLAVVFHARDLWNVARTSPDGALGPEEFAIKPVPVSAAVRALMRPPQGRPRFGAPAVTP